MFNTRNKQQRPAKYWTEKNGTRRRRSDYTYEKMFNVLTRHELDDTGRHSAAGFFLRSTCIRPPRRYRHRSTLVASPSPDATIKQKRAKRIERCRRRRCRRSVVERPKRFITKPVHMPDRRVRRSSSVYASASRVENVKKGREIGPLQVHTLITAWLWWRCSHSAGDSCSEERKIIFYKWSD